MKRIVTFDKANQPYGFAQLDNVGNIPANVTASYATTAGTANNALTASHVIVAETAIFATTAGNGTQWETTADGIAYGDGNVTIGLASQPGVHVSKYQPIVGTANNQSEMAALFANSTYDSSFISPNIYNVSLYEDNYALLFEGSITVPTTGTYLFGLGSDDASDAFIDDTKIADYYGNHGGNPNEPGGNRYPISLTAGKHTLVVRFVEFSGNDFVSLLWSQDSGTTWEPVPDSWFTYQATSLSQIKLNNGAIITGSINFGDKSLIQSVSASSGDGLNASTLILKPDASLNTDQYIVLDPTGGTPGHIHIRAGGTIDASGADLFLGGEDNHVKVSDTGDTVDIVSTNKITLSATSLISATGSVEITGSLKVNGNAIDRPYKVYTALLTQSGEDGPDSTYSGDLVIGRTYQIFDLGGAAGYDFTNVGAPNNNIDTWFVATGTTPNSWGTNVCLNYNSGAPVVTVLENTIGNIWCEYVGAGTYQIKCDNLFTADKTTIAHKSLTSWANGISSETHDPSIFNILTFKMDDGNAGDGLLNKTPIEIRVYN